MKSLGPLFLLLAGAQLEGFSLAYFPNDIDCTRQEVWETLHHQAIKKHFSRRGENWNPCQLFIAVCVPVTLPVC